MSRWKSLKRWQKWLIGGVAALVALSVVGAITAPGEEATKPFSDAEARAIIDEYEASRERSTPSAATAAPAASAPALSAAEVKEQGRLRRAEAARQKKIAAARAKVQAKERAREAAAAARAREARERALRGTLVEGFGAKVITINAAQDGPLVVEASHNGGSNFVVELVGNGLNELMINEIGSYSGTVAVQEVLSGRYRVSVQADGSWSIRHRQPRPQGSEPAILRTFQGTGSAVLPVRSPEDLQPIISARNSGDSNFVVQLVAYGDDVTGSELLFNEIGPYRGETLTEVPAGDYLIVVEAAGPWSLRFQR